MAHWSENSNKLELESIRINDLSQLELVDCAQPSVYLFWLPSVKDTHTVIDSKEAFEQIARYIGKTHKESIICILTTPANAARLLPLLENSLQFQLWVAVKTTSSSFSNQPSDLPSRHAALLVLTRYRHSLRHTKTRIKYTYCPACGKTTKDYGGKKHTYHEYGTLMSDIWRDIECDPCVNIETVVDRLCDVFGLEPYHRMYLLDLRACKELATEEKTSSLSILTTTEQKLQKGAKLRSQLFNGDCLDALASVPDNSIDFCFADPPYNLKKKYDRWNDALESVKYFEWCDKWLLELYRVLKPGRTLAVLNIPLWAVRHYQYLCSIMNFQAWIAWESLSFPVRMVMPSHYAIICFSKGNPRPLPGMSKATQTISEDCLRPLEEFYCLRSACISHRQKLKGSDRTVISDLWHDIHRLKHNSRRVDHPCQLPPLLMRRLFTLFTNPGEIILDCFNGAGTSTLVAQQMNRRFIGIELSSQYHLMAGQRHEQILAGEDPFAKENSIPIAKNSPVQRLPKQKYQVSKKTLQLDVKQIAHELGRLPTRKEVERLSRFPIEYFDKYFISWGEVCAAARTTGMSELPEDRNAETRQLDLFFGATGQN